MKQILRVFRIRFGLGVLAATLLAACATDLRPMGPALGVAHLAPGPEGPVAVMADAYRLPLAVHVPKGPIRGVILALHGMNDYANAWSDAAPWFTEAGFIVYAPDLRGFGRTVSRGYWPTEASLIADTHALLRILAARHPEQPLYVMGESMGGALTIAALSAPDAPPVQGAILLAPAVWGRSTMGLLPRLSLAVVNSLLPGFPLTGEGLDVQASDNLEMLRKLARDPWIIKQTRVDAIDGLVDLMDSALAAAPRLRVPTLLIYGKKDELIPLVPICRFLADVPPGAPLTLLWRDDGWHLLLRDLGGKQVATQILAWIAAQGHARPSIPSRQNEVCP